MAKVDKYREYIQRYILINRIINPFLMDFGY